MSARSRQSRQKPDQPEDIDAALHESELKYRTLFNASSDAIILFHQDQVADCNHQAPQLFGCTREQFIGSNPFAFSPPRQPDGRLSRTKAARYYAAALKGKPQLFEWQHIKNDGTPFDVEVSLSRVELQGGVYVQAIMRDITERKRMEEALRQSEAKFRSIIEYSRDGIVLFDEEGRIIEWNRGLESIFGIKREEVLGLLAWDERFQRMTPQKDIKGLFKTLFDTGDSPFLNKTIEYEFHKPDGSYLAIQEINFPIRTEKGYMCCCFIRDITERKQAELALRDSEETYRTIFETGTAKGLYGEDGIILLGNSEAERVFGYTREEVEGKKSWVDFVAEDELEKVKRYGAMLGSSGRTAASFETKMKDKDGNLKHVIITVGVIPGSKKRVASFLDITDRKRTEEQLAYLSLHDALTGLYNRTFFEEEMHRLESGRHHPVGIIVCDVDGLKLVNDTMGHGSGDNLLQAAAQVIRSCFREGDVLARIGGDEFSVLMPESSRDAVEKAVDRIKKAVEQYNTDHPDLPLSISIGCAVTNGESCNIGESFKEADNNMYRDKLYRGQSAHSFFVNTLLKAMGTREIVSEECFVRLQRLLTSTQINPELIEKFILLFENNSPQKP